MKLAIIVPTFNEAENIPILLDKLFKLSTLYESIEFDIFIVDDNSPDKTYDIAQLISNNLFSNNFKINLILKNKREGLGSAYKYIFNYLIQGTNIFDYIIQMDADLSHDPIYIHKFIELAKKKNVDFVSGSRYIRGGSVHNWSWWRVLISRNGNYFIRIMLGSVFSDYTGGYNMISWNLLKKLNINKLNNLGYGFLIILKFNSSNLTRKISEIPIIFYDRKYGVSKIPLSTILVTFCLVIKLSLMSRIK